MNFFILIYAIFALLSWVMLFAKDEAAQKRNYVYAFLGSTAAVVILHMIC